MRWETLSLDELRYSRGGVGRNVGSVVCCGDVLFEIAAPEFEICPNEGE